MTLDPDTRKQLIEARERIKAQIFADEGAGGYKGGPPDFRGVYAELKDELRQINEILGPDPNDEGDLYQATQNASPIVESNYEPPSSVDTDANMIASRVVVDDSATWNLSHVVLIAAVLLIGVAVALAI